MVSHGNATVLFLVWILVTNVIKKINETKWQLYLIEKKNPVVIYYYDFTVIAIVVLTNIV